MDRLAYADLDNDKYHYRIADSSSRTTFDPNRGIQATDINDKVFPKESIIRTSIGSAIPFPGVTAKALTSHSRVWETDRMDSKLISATSKLMWAMWEAIRRLTKPRYNPRTITLYAIRIPDNSADDILRANACEVLDKTSDPGVKRANWFAKSSAQHLYFLQIPLGYIESMQVLTLRELLNILPLEYFKTAVPRLRSGRDVSELVFNPAPYYENGIKYPADRFCDAEKKILARKYRLEVEEEAKTKESLQPKSSPLLEADDGTTVLTEAVAALSVSSRRLNETTGKLKDVLKKRTMDRR